MLAWVLLLGFFAISGAARGVYAAHAAEPSGRFELLSILGFISLLWFWFAQQIKHHRPRLVLDFGVFLVVFWFVLMPYYLWRYERWWGLLKAAAVGAAWLGSWLIAMVVWLLLR